MYLSTDQLSSPESFWTAPPYTINSFLEKGSGECNEDILVQEDNLFGVFDGATSLDVRRFQGGLSGGLLAAKTAAHAFSDDDHSLSHLAEKANQLIRQSQLEQNVDMDERQNLWSTCMAVVRLTETQLEYCQTGDSAILFIQKDGGYNIVTSETDIDRDTLLLWKETYSSPGNSIHEILSEQIRKVRLQMNVGYGVLNGEPEALNFIRHGFVNLSDISDIILFTDGLQLPRENPAEDHDWQGFVELYRRGGLQSVHNHVRHLQQNDQSCRKYPRFKLHDDIAAVSITC